MEPRRSATRKSKTGNSWRRSIQEPKDIDPVAVVIVESTRVGILDKDGVVEAMRGSDGALLYEFFEMMAFLEPDVEYPWERGF
jgi:hypothetical protein